MRIEIQAAVPYEHSLLWDLHRSYYHQQGVQAFLTQEVPYNISSNPCLAGQAVRLLRASLHSVPKLPERISVLEVGGGLGIFAYNFLQAVASQAPELMPRLDYWLSDYAADTLTELAQHPALAEWLGSGRLRLCLLDGIRPEQAHDLQGQTLPLPENGFQAIIANYFFSTLPTSVLLKQGENWLRQLTRLDWLPLGSEPEPEAVQAFCQALATQLRSYRLVDQLTEAAPQYRMFVALQQAQDIVATELENTLPEAVADFRDWLETRLAEAWAQALNMPDTRETSQLETLRATVHDLLGKPLFERASYAPEALETEHRFEISQPAEIFAEPAHHLAAEALTSDWFQASVGYSAQALASLKALTGLASEQGILLISDKAYANRDWMRGLQPERATRHGGSLAHPVNFPLFESVLAAEQLNVCRTQDPANALHSLLVSKCQMPAALTAQFNADFIQHPGNEISHALLEGGHALLQQERLEAAGRTLRRGLDYRPSDATLQYLLAVCLLNQEDYAHALNLLNQPHDDLFGLFNREILQAEAWRLTEHPEQALPFYLASLRHGENSQSYYNLALCHIELGQPAAAHEALIRALALDPDDLETLGLLASLDIVTPDSVSATDRQSD